MNFKADQGRRSPSKHQGLFSGRTNINLKHHNHSVGSPERLIEQIKVAPKKKKQGSFKCDIFKKNKQSDNKNPKKSRISKFKEGDCSQVLRSAHKKIKGYKQEKSNISKKQTSHRSRAEDVEGSVSEKRCSKLFKMTGLKFRPGKGGGGKERGKRSRDGVRSYGAGRGGFASFKLATFDSMRDTVKSGRFKYLGIRRESRSKSSSSFVVTPKGGNKVVGF